MTSDDGSEQAGRILVIDDDDAARMAVCAILRASGFTTFSLPSAIGAIELVLRESIRAVVIDLHMPTMSGDRLAQLFRDHRRLRDLVVVLISGEPQERLEQIARRIPGVRAISKEHMRLELPTVLRIALAQNARLSPEQLRRARYPSRAPRPGMETARHRLRSPDEQDDDDGSAPSSGAA